MTSSPILSDLNKGHRYLFLTLVLATFMAFWKIGQHPITEWDEARQAVNAYEMLEGGDYINYYYGDELDTWNAKPPLLIWTITASYQAFGYNEFALRLPSALAALVFFYFCFLFVNLYQSKAFAFLTCLMLISGRTIFADHVSRTADFDAFLLPFLMGSIWAFCSYIDFNKKWSHIYLGIFLGLAFYSKGTACVFIIPGMILYALLTKKLVIAIKSWRTWLALGIFIGIAGSWLAISWNYGARSDGSDLSEHNAITTMLYYDTVERFSSSEFHGHESDPLYLFKTMDIRFNIWGHLFIAFFLGIIVWLLKTKTAIKNVISDSENRIYVLSLSIVLSISVILSISESKMDWYLVPAFPFMAVIVVFGIVQSVKWYSFLKWPFAILFVYLFGRRFSELNQPKESVDSWLAHQSEKIENADAVYLLDVKSQDLYAYLKWRNDNTHFIGTVDDIEPEHSNYVIIWSDQNPDAPQKDCKFSYCMSTHGS